MKKVIIALNLLLLLSLVGSAQSRKKTPEIENPQNNSSERTRNSGGKSNGGLLLRSGATLEGELQNALDVKNASIGDEVVLKVTKSIKQNGEVVIPKGTRLIGRVTEVQEKTKNNALSKIGVVFEQIQGKNLNAPLNVSITTIVKTSAGANAGGGLLDADMSGAANSAGRVSGGSAGGGGLLGGVGSTIGGVLNTTTNAVGSATGTAGQTLGSAAGTVGRTVGGIRISPAADASVQGASTLSAQGKNVRLEKGAILGIRLNESIEN